MCGITGFLCDDPKARAALPAMTAALALLPGPRPRVIAAGTW